MSTPNPTGPSLVPPTGPNMGAPAPPPPRHNVGVWIAAGLGILVLFSIVFGLAMMRLGLSLARNVSVLKSGNSVEIKTPDGKIALRAGVPADLGLPVYPGATTLDNSGSVEFIGDNEQRSGVSGAKYSTPDSMEKVDQWYRQRLGSDFERQGPGPKQVIVRGVVVEIEGGDIAYISQAEGVSVIALKPQGDHVQIELARIGKQGQAQ